MLGYISHLDGESRTEATVGASVDRDSAMNGQTFQAELAHLIRQAEAAGVDVEGGWECNGDGDLPEWGIEIYAVEPDDRDEEAPVDS